MIPEFTIGNFTAKQFTHIAGQLKNKNIDPDTQLTLVVYQEHFVVTDCEMNMIAWMAINDPETINTKTDGNGNF